MVQSLEEYVAQATRAYEPTSTAIQAQINALPSQLQAANEQINRNYAQQQAGLNRQRNMAAETASMQAAGSGGSFGGAANIANRKYYDQAFVPAVTQLRTGQTNELAQARLANDNDRLNLAGQLANIKAQANQQALAQYYSDQEAERARAAQLQAQREANAAQQAYYQYMLEAAKQDREQQNNTKAWDFGHGFKLYQDDYGNAVYSKNGERISAGAFLTGTGAYGTNWDLWNDVWDNGVSTYGVGSDTVEGFGRSPLIAKGLNNYNDLFGRNW